MRVSSFLRASALSLSLLPASAMSMDVVTDGNGANIATGKSAKIDRFGTCRIVTNRDLKDSVFVPTMHPEEWSVGETAFLWEQRQGLETGPCIASTPAGSISGAAGWVGTAANPAFDWVDYTNGMAHAVSFGHGIEFGGMPTAPSPSAWCTSNNTSKAFTSHYNQIRSQPISTMPSSIMIGGDCVGDKNRPPLGPIVNVADGVFGSEVFPGQSVASFPVYWDGGSVGGRSPLKALKDKGGSLPVTIEVLGGFPVQIRDISSMAPSDMMSDFTSLPLSPTLIATSWVTKFQFIGTAPAEDFAGYVVPVRLTAANGRTWEGDLTYYSSAVQFPETAPVAQGTTVTSSGVVSGLPGTVSYVRVGADEFRINNGPWTAGGGNPRSVNLNNGDTITLRTKAKTPTSDFVAHRTGLYVDAYINKIYKQIGHWKVNIQ